jgi:polygalacturonase
VYGPWPILRKETMAKQLDRRRFIQAAAAVAGIGALRAQHESAWDEAPRILARIHPPTFAKREFNVKRYGAAGDGKTDAAAAIAKAIAECNAAGGGRVIVPNGVYLTGPIHLKSNVHLHLDDKATLLFTRDTKRYLPLVYSRWEGVELMNYSACIYANNVENIALTGAGTLDGNAGCETAWWSWKGRQMCGWRPGQPVQDPARNRLFDLGARDVPVTERRFGEGSYLRPNLVQFCHSKNILIEGPRMTNAPMFEVNPVLCSNVIVRGIHVDSHGPNNDGCDPDSSRDVLIENCTFDTGDDCIAIKAGRNRDGRRVGAPSENIVIRNCRMKDGHGGLTIGSEMSGGVRNVFIENCQLDSPHLEQALRFKTNAMRGGAIEHIFFRNITVGEVANAVLQIDCLYEEGEKGPEKPVVRDIHVSEVTCKKSKYALQLRGLAASPIQDIHLEDCDFEGVQQANSVQHVQSLSAVRVTINGQPFEA